MKVRYGMSWEANKREHDLADVLEPDGMAGFGNDGGQLERVEARARITAEFMGRLLDLLVEKKVITLDEAVNQIAHIYGEVEEIDQ